MVNIFTYLDYRDFLRDYYLDKKKNSPFFSYRFIGNHVDMDSSFIVKVLHGDRHIAIKKINLFAKLLKLSKDEAAYFEMLVYFAKAKTDQQRKLFFDKLFTCSPVSARKLDIGQYEFFRKWYYSAVWSIINCIPFAGDYRSLAAQCMPAISPNEAKRAVNLLESLGVIARENDGRYHTTTTNLTTGQNWHSFVVENYQREMIRLAGEAIQRFPKQEREISTVTMCVDEKTMPEIQAYVQQFRTSLIKLANSRGENGGRVFQLNIQVFPLSAPDRENS